MKRKYFIAICFSLIFFAVNIANAQQWTKITPTFHPDGDYILYYGTFIDNFNGWFADYNTCKIFRSSDGGYNWYLQNDTFNSANNNVWDICFADSLHGWVLVKNIDSTFLLQTKDSGSYLERN